MFERFRYRDVTSAPGQLYVLGGEVVQHGGSCRRVNVGLEAGDGSMLADGLMHAYAKVYAVSEAATSTATPPDSLFAYKVQVPNCNQAEYLLTDQLSTMGARQCGAGVFSDEGTGGAAAPEGLLHGDAMLQLLRRVSRAVWVMADREEETAEPASALTPDLLACIETAATAAATQPPGRKRQAPEPAENEAASKVARQEELSEEAEAAAALAAIPRHAAKVRKRQPARQTRGSSQARLPQEQMCAALAAYVQQHQALPSSRTEFVHEGMLRKLGSWLNSRRLEWRKGSLAAEVQQQIEAAVGPALSAEVWAPRRPQESMSTVLAAYVQQHGALPSSRTEFEYGGELLKLGSWLNSRRGEQRRGLLAPELRLAIEAAVGPTLAPDVWAPRRTPGAAAPKAGAAPGQQQALAAALMSAAEQAGGVTEQAGDAAEQVEQLPALARAMLQAAELSSRTTSEVSSEESGDSGGESGGKSNESTVSDGDQGGVSGATSNGSQEQEGRGDGGSPQQEQETGSPPP